MADTAIEWADVVWNPSTGCDKVSPGCGLPRWPGDEPHGQCYALTMAARLKGMGQAKYQNDGDPRTSGPGFGLTVHPDVLDLPLRWRKPRRVFVNSMSDLFHDGVPAEFVARVFAVMSQAPQHTFQVLTKRHGRMRSLLNSEHFQSDAHSRAIDLVQDRTVEHEFRWPPRNVWLGVSVEDQRWADIRIPALLDTPAAVRWISAEPLLGPVDLFGDFEKPGPATIVNGYSYPVDYGTGREYDATHEAGIDWVVAGGESGPNARPMHPDWARSLRDQCTAAGVPFLFKQWGGRTPKAGGRELDGRTWDQYPEAVRHAG